MVPQRAATKPLPAGLWGRAAASQEASTTSPTTSPSTLFEHIPQGPRAIVIGSGVAGLLATRAALNHFSQVIQIDRDELTKWRVEQESFLEVSVGEKFMDTINIFHQA
jgi:hypothetical protein